MSLASGHFAQRRPESELRRHAPAVQGSLGDRIPASLNEGRSLNSGDTGIPSNSPRRPTESSPLNEGRSLNSGDTSARIPAMCPTHPDRAQRRPESELRRHRREPRRRVHLVTAPLNEGRSLNSGDTTHRSSGRRARDAQDAQRRPESELRRHIRERSRELEAAGTALNEGRSLNSGDTRSCPTEVPPGDVFVRSTKAGV